MLQKRGNMEKLAKFYPPGYPVKEELAGMSCFLGIALIFNIRFFPRLERMLQTLSYMEGGERILIPGAVAESFTELTEKCWFGFWGVFLFLAAMTVGRYLYYWSPTKSIYVMRRIPKRGVVFASCFKSSVLWSGLIVLLALVLFGLYLGLYWLLVPAECMPRFW